MVAPVVVEQAPSSLQGCSTLPTNISTEDQSVSFRDIQFVRTGSSAVQPSFPAHEPVRHDHQVSRASSASAWTTSVTPSRSASTHAAQSTPAPEVDSLSADGSADGPNHLQDYIEEEDLYRSLAENVLAVVPFGMSLELSLIHISEPTRPY